MLKSFSNRKKRVNRINVAKRRWGGEVEFPHLTFDSMNSVIFSWSKGGLLLLLWTATTALHTGGWGGFVVCLHSSCVWLWQFLVFQNFEEWSLMLIFANLPSCAGKLGCSPPSLPWLDPPPLCRPQEPWCLHHGSADRPWERPCLRPLHRPGASGLETGRQERDALAVPSTSRRSGRCEEPIQLSGKKYWLKSLRLSWCEISTHDCRAEKRPPSTSGSTTPDSLFTSWGVWPLRLKYVFIWICLAFILFAVVYFYHVFMALLYLIFFLHSGTIHLIVGQCLEECGAPDLTIQAQNNQSNQGKAQSQENNQNQKNPGHAAY